MTLRNRRVRRVACTLLIAVIASAFFKQAAGADTPNALKEKIVNELQRQDAAWDDLSVKFTIRDAIKDAKSKTFEPAALIHGQWVVTQTGRERVRRETVPLGGDPRTAQIEEASFDGEYYMTASNQRQGSGGVGHQTERFLMTLDSPKSFGLVVTGLDLGMPMSLQEFVQNASVTTAIDVATNSVVVEGPDPLAGGFRLRLVLSSTYGYRPTRIETSDRNGLFTTYDIFEYQEVRGTHGSFWFPKRGERHGYSPRPREVGTISTFSLDEIECNKHPDYREFRLTYPKDALILSTDTGEGFYLTTDSTPDDVPRFEGKQMPYREHDSHVHAAPVATHRRLNVLLLLNACVILLVCTAVIRSRRRRNR